MALFSALLWALHPIQNQAVTYIAQRMTSMSAMFFPASLLCFIADRRTHSRARFLAFAGYLGCGLVTLGTKEHTVVLPFALFLYDRYFLGAADPSSVTTGGPPWTRFIAAAVLLLGGEF